MTSRARNQVCQETEESVRNVRNRQVCQDASGLSGNDEVIHRNPDNPDWRVSHKYESTSLSISGDLSLSRARQSGLSGSAESDLKKEIVSLPNKEAWSLLQLTLIGYGLKGALYRSERSRIWATRFIASEGTN